jgi:hypothetical protein
VRRGSSQGQACGKADAKQAKPGFHFSSPVRMGTAHLFWAATQNYSAPVDIMKVNIPCLIHKKNL